MDKLIEIFSRLPVHPRVVIAVVFVSLIVGFFFFLALLSDDHRKRVLWFVFCNPVFYVFIAVAIGTAIFIPINSDKSESGNPPTVVPRSAPTQQKQAEVQAKKKDEPVTKRIDHLRNSGNVVQEGEKVPLSPQTTKAAPIPEAEQISRIRAEKRDRALALHALAKKLEKLGYSADISMALAEKVGRKEYQQEKFVPGIHVAAIIKNGQLQSDAKLTWDEPEKQVVTERYAEGDYVVYHVIGQDVWFRIGELP